MDVCYKAKTQGTEIPETPHASFSPRICIVNMEISWVEETLHLLGAGFSAVLYGPGGGSH
jgi:hypothetical protein